MKFGFDCFYLRRKTLFSYIRITPDLAAFTQHFWQKKMLIMYSSNIIITITSLIQMLA